MAMADLNASLEDLMGVEGAMCAAIVDYNSGMMLGSVGSGVDMELASAGTTEVMRAKARTMRMLDLDDRIEDILISLGMQYQIIRPVVSIPGIFIFYVLDAGRATLALARRKAGEVEQALVL